MKTLISTRWNLSLICGVIFIVVLFTAGESNAIPSFSRKYNTSCATCHISFPRLTAFGEAFRRNGYQFPDGTDLENTKEDPVSLGSEGNKKAFPDALWPGAIPGSSPLSVILELETTYTPKEEQKWNFNPFEGELVLAMGGTLGEDISFWGEVEVAEDAIEIERAGIIFDNLFGGTTATANLKIGKFEPGVFSFSNHRRLGPRYSITIITLGDNMWALEAAQTGIELNGVIGEGRLGYNIGLVEGHGNLDNSDKDFYGHATYKIGGMRLDGVVAEEVSMKNPTQPWEDNSITIGGFIYNGTASLTDDIKDKFTMLGGDVNISYGRFNLLGAFARHNNDNPFTFTDSLGVQSTGVKGVMNSYMVEATYIVFPWLIPLVRFESNKVDGDLVAQSNISPVIQVLVRANVRIALEFNWASEPSENDPTSTTYSFEEFALGINLGF